MKKLFLLITMLGITFTYISCQKDNLKQVTTKPLKLKIYALKNNSPIGGTAFFRPRLNQPFSPTSMRLFVDDKLINTTKSGPWYITWNTINELTGSKHKIYLSMTDKNKKVVQSKPITVIVSNINFTILVQTPKNTPKDDRIFITGNRKALGMKPSGEWSPRSAYMTRINRHLWKKIIRVGFNENLEYEFTRSSWATKGRDRNGKTIHANINIKGRSKIKHVIANWGINKGISKPKGPLVYFGKKPSSMITIFWQTKNPTQTVLEYSHSKNKIRTYKNRKKSIFHTVRLRDLKSETIYNYKTGNDLTGTFKTGIKPGKQKDFSFLVFGDFQGGNRILNLIKQKEKADFIIHTGDMVNDGYNESQWNQYFNWLKSVATIFTMMTVPGNHEHEAPQYYRYHPLPGNGIYYNFIYGNTEFIMINSERDFTIGSAQNKWLKKILKKSSRNKKIKWRIAIYHTPSYSTGKHGDDKVAQKYLDSLFDRYKINLVLNGHEHAYQITKPIINGKVAKRGITHIISGGAGATLFGFKVDKGYISFRKKTYHYCKYTVYKNKILHQAITSNGKLLHKAIIKQR